MRQSLHGLAKMCMPRSLLFITLLTVWFTLDQKPAHACTCTPEEIDHYYAEYAELVFRGTVVESIEYGRIRQGKFLVDTVWRGTLQRTVYVHVTVVGECGVGFRLGAEYVVAADRDLWSELPGWEAWHCSVWTPEGLTELSVWTPEGLAKIDTMGRLGRGKTPPAVQLDRATPLLLTVMPWVKMTDPAALMAWLYDLATANTIETAVLVFPKKLKDVATMLSRAIVKTPHPWLEESLISGGVFLYQGGIQLVHLSDSFTWPHWLPGRMWRLSWGCCLY